jgi:ribose transport system ATP-binding protein
MGMVSEDRKEEGLALGMTIADNLTLPGLERFGRWGFFAPSKQASAAEEWVGKLSVRCQSSQQKLGDLSGGNQQKVALARLLQQGVDVLLLDEPTRGIDVGSKEQIYKLIDQLAGEGKAVLVVSSYLPELFGICDRIAVMRRGELGVARPVGELDSESVIKEAASA